MDKRRYLPREPRNPRSPMGMGDVETGNPAKDGYVLRHREPLKRERYGKDSCHSEHYAAGSLMTETDAMMRDIYGED